LSPVTTTTGYLLSRSTFLPKIFGGLMALAGDSLTAAAHEPSRHDSVDYVATFEYSNSCMQQALRVIAHPVRLSILREVCLREQTVSELASALRLRQPTTSQHLLALRRAKLVVVRAEANRRYYRANATELAKLRTYLSGFWQDSLGALKAAAEMRALPGKTA
jgi:DNA-binding transcriptional ArsR family regulator